VGAFPIGVAMVTGISDEGEHPGMTVSSFNSVSVTSPLVYSASQEMHAVSALGAGFDITLSTGR
jgi:flavin reductase (DIM6/NTAB) family NADH-FMN oxidoreductase RutF